MKQRQRAPDFIKGVAIVLMVYGHLTMVGACADVQNGVKSWIYSFHMPLFLLISGMFFSSAGDVAQKAKRIFLRVGLPYLIFISVYLLGLILIQKVGIPTSNAPPESVVEFVKTILLYPRGGYWFLHSLLLIQLALVLGRGCMSERGASSLLIFTALLLLLLAAFELVRVRTIVYFLIGMAIRSVTDRKLDTPWYFGAACIVGVWALNYFLKLEELSVFSYTEMVWCLSILITLWGLAEKFSEGLGIKIVAWIGRNSLAILVFHSIFIVLLKPLAGLFTQFEPSGWLYSLGVTIMTTAFCIISALTLDKTKLSPYLFGTAQCYMPFRDAQKDLPKIESK